LKRWNGETITKWKKLLRAYLWGIETYQYCYTLWFLILSCEPTYEELKQLLPNPSSIANLVASLPMRNWNAIAVAVIIPLSSLRAYLWGIETLWCYTVMKAILQLRAYLWGIETSYIIIYIVCWRGSCEPTYEELKQWIVR